MNFEDGDLKMKNSSLKKLTVTAHESHSHDMSDESKSLMHSLQISLHPLTHDLQSRINKGIQHLRRPSLHRLNLVLPLHLTPLTLLPHSPRGHVGVEADVAVCNSVGEGHGGRVHGQKLLLGPMHSRFGVVARCIWNVETSTETNAPRLPRNAFKRDASGSGEPLAEPKEICHQRPYSLCFLPSYLCFRLPLPFSTTTLHISSH
ncbi:Lachrymatory-factor synthase [Senna tora]|uniref:Lachrymatory-factor synthase n=1 Tax=Senna tora TaxID=362788 RepID=A0A834WEK2_9FABA|nr:Lachrymatory-factor synthase [Senna tora]